jgi:hypothetical protein
VDAPKRDEMDDLRTAPIIIIIIIINIIINIILQYCNGLFYSPLLRNIKEDLEAAWLFQYSLITEVPAPPAFVCSLFI